MDELRLLKPEIRMRLSELFLIGQAEADVTDGVLDFPRQPAPSVKPLRHVLDEAASRFHDDRTSSDSWAAPRVHAALRITRREAADPRLWAYLATVACPEYVRWRWADQDGKTVLTRFVGPEYKHAIGRLWWGAELTRNGSSYEHTVQFFSVQDLQNSWQKLKFMHHRPAAVALLRFFSTLNDGGFAVKDQIRDFSKHVNFALGTVVLDAVAENTCTDSAVWSEWTSVCEPNENPWMEVNPEGPSDAPAPEESVEAVLNLLRRIADATGLGRNDEAGAPVAEAAVPES